MVIKGAVKLSNVHVDLNRYFAKLKVSDMQNNTFPKFSRTNTQEKQQHNMNNH